jgi:hypothetical protein
MTYVDDQYISVARKSEVQHHEYTMEQLRAKIAQLTKSGNIIPDSKNCNRWKTRCPWITHQFQQ